MEGRGTAVSVPAVSFLSLYDHACTCRRLNLASFHLFQIDTSINPTAPHFLNPCLDPSNKLTDIWTIVEIPEIQLLAAQGGVRMTVITSGSRDPQADVYGVRAHLLSPLHSFTPSITITSRAATHLSICLNNFCLPYSPSFRDRLIYRSVSRPLISIFHPIPFRAFGQ
jgi:hypothetical protein